MGKGGLSKDRTIVSPATDTRSSGMVNVLTDNLRLPAHPAILSGSKLSLSPGKPGKSAGLPDPFGGKIPVSGGGLVLPADNRRLPVNNLTASFRPKHSLDFSPLRETFLKIQSGFSQSRRLRGPEVSGH